MSEFLIRDFARNEIALLLENEAVRKRFETQCRRYLNLRIDNPERPPFGSMPPYELCEMCALLAATHDKYCEAPVRPMPLYAWNSVSAVLNDLRPANQAWQELCLNVVFYASATPGTNAHPITISTALENLRYCLEKVKQDLVEVAPTVSAAVAGPTTDGPYPPNCLAWQGNQFTLPPILWKLLCVLWNREPRPIEEVASEVWSSTDTKDATIKAALSRLNARLVEFDIPFAWGCKSGYITHL